MNGTFLQQNYISQKETLFQIVIVTTEVIKIF